MDILTGTPEATFRARRILETTFSVLILTFIPLLRLLSVRILENCQERLQKQKHYFNIAEYKVNIEFIITISCTGNLILGVGFRPTGNRNLSCDP